MSTQIENDPKKKGTSKRETAKKEKAAQKEKAQKSKAVKKAAKAEKRDKRNQRRKARSKSIKRFNRWLSFLIVLGFAGFIFYTGWIQYKIPEGYGALVFTKFSWEDGHKSGGYDRELTTHNGFHWRWEKLFPTNLTMHLYPLSLRTVQVESRGTLPSGDLYLSFIEADGVSFDWNVSFDLTYRLKSDLIPSLAADEGVLPENLEDYFTQETSRLEDDLYGLLKDYTPSMDDGEAMDRLMEKLSDDHPYLELTSLSPVIVELPDRELYDKARTLYFAFLDEKNRALEEMIANVAPKTAVNEEKMLILEEYGKVLTEYPVLIDFFALDENNDFGRFNPSDLMPETLEGSE